MSQEFPPAPTVIKSSRRSWIKRALLAGTALGAATTGWGVYEAGWITLERVTIVDPAFSGTWRGLRIVQLTDLHHGPVTGIEHIHEIVRQANELEPDLILLTGDYSHRGLKYVYPVMGALANLRAPLGVFAVPGNHEYYNSIGDYRLAIQAGPIRNLENTNFELRRNGQSLYLLGVDDLMRGRPNLGRALEGFAEQAPAILLAHNPDMALQRLDPRIRLVLSGHTHGGQISLPFIGPPVAPRGFTSGYIAGRYDLPSGQIYVSRGLGTIIPPLRIGVPPELTLLTLTDQAANPAPG